MKYRCSRSYFPLPTLVLQVGLSAILLFRQKDVDKTVKCFVSKEKMVKIFCFTKFEMKKS